MSPKLFVFLITLSSNYKETVNCRFHPFCNFPIDGLRAESQPGEVKSLGEDSKID